jgi:hypothetical protein
MFLKSTKNYQFFETNHDQFQEKIFSSFASEPNLTSKIFIVILGTHFLTYFRENWHLARLPRTSKCRFPLIEILKKVKIWGPLMWNNSFLPTAPQKKARTKVDMPPPRFRPAWTSSSGNFVSPAASGPYNNSRGQAPGRRFK